MKLYLDDDSVDGVLIRLLRQSGHDIEVPSDAGLMGRADPVHLKHAIDVRRVLLTGNHDDFADLHELIQAAQGRHSGILVIRKDNDPKRDMTRRGIVTALANVEAAGFEMANEFQVLNHWR